MKTDRSVVATFVRRHLVLSREAFHFLMKQDFVRLDNTLMSLPSKHTIIDSLKGKILVK